MAGLREEGRVREGSGGESGVTTCTHCGSPERHRSDADHKMFHAVIQRVFENWPEHMAEKFKPTDAMHLYGWLLIEVEYMETAEVENKDHDAVVATVKAIYEITKRKIHCLRIFPTEKGYRIAIPKSLSYAEAGKKKYEEVRAKVYELVEVILGVPIATLKREAQKEAA